MESVSIQRILIQRFEENRANDPSFSLRGFAKRLGISPGSLSSMMKGTRKVSREMLFRLAKPLELTQEECHELLSSLEGSPPPPETLSRIQGEISRYRALTDWQYLAVKKLSQTRGYRRDPEWIAVRLGINQKRVEALLQEMDAEPVSENSAERGELEQLASHRAKRSDLELALRKLEAETELLPSHYSSRTIRIDPARISEVREKIEAFLDSLEAPNENPENEPKNDPRSDPKNDNEEIYRASIQFFPLTHK